MSNVRYNAGTMTIEVDGLDDVSAVLGDLRKKTPAVAKVAINATARQARKLMIAEAKARYAVNSAGKRHLSDLVQRKKASNSSLSAELRIASYRNDLGYFQTRPNRPFMGHDVAQAPEYFTARVLKTSPMKPLKQGLPGGVQERARGHGAAHRGHGALPLHRAQRRTEHQRQDADHGQPQCGGDALDHLAGSGAGGGAVPGGKADRAGRAGLSTGKEKGVRV